MAEEQKPAEAKPAAESAPAATPPPEGKKGGKKMGLAVGVIGILVGLFVLLIGGGMAFAAFMPASNGIVKTMAKTPVLNLLVFPEKKGRVLLDDRATSIATEEEITDVIALDEDGKMAIGLSIGGGAVTEEYGFTGVSGSVEAKYSEDRFQGDATITIESDDGEFTGDVDLASDSSGLYLKVASLSDDAKDYVMDYFANSMGLTPAQAAQYVDLDGVIGNWYKIDATDAAGLASGTGLTSSFDSDMTDEEQEAVFKAFSDFLAEENAEYVGTETVRGSKTYHFQYDVTAEELADLQEDIAEATDEEFDREDYLENSEDLKSLKIDIWLDTSGEVAKVGLSMESEVSDETMTVSLTIELWDQGTTQEIEVPSKAKDFDDLYTDLLVGFGDYNW